jgi:hypothetical protein
MPSGPVSRAIDALISANLSPEAQSALFAEFARGELTKADEINTEALGKPPEHVTIVDGRRGAEEESNRGNGSTIEYEFQVVLASVFEWIGEQLVLHSPVGTGRDPHPGLFAKSFLFFADGTEVDPAHAVPKAAEYVFLNTQIYSRKIEQGESPQAPDGVFEAVASMAAKRFSNVARITFSYRTPNGNQSNISRVGPLQVKRRARGFDSNGNSIGGQFLPGSGVRAGNQAERLTRQPAIVITLE